MTIPPPLLFLGAALVASSPIAAIWALQRRSDFVRRWSTPATLLIVTAEIVAVMSYFLLAAWMNE